MAKKEQTEPQEQGLRTQPAGKQSKGRILYRLWKYMGRSRLLLVLAVVLSFKMCIRDSRHLEHRLHCPLRGLRRHVPERHRPGYLHQDP